MTTEQEEQLAALDSNYYRLLQRVTMLEKQVHDLRALATRIDHWENTLKSRWWKRLWWWVQGYRLFALGTWYKAKWNQSARKYG